MAQDPPKGPKLQLQIDDAVSQGAYANLVLVNHTENEFVLDFAFMQPNTPRAKILSRIISSPRHTLRLLRALEHNVRRFEERFGPINAHDPAAGPASDEPDPDGGTDPDDGPDEPPLH